MSRTLVAKTNATAPAVRSSITPTARVGSQAEAPNESAEPVAEATRRDGAMWSYSAMRVDAPPRGDDPRPVVRNALNSPGRPLEASTRSFFEPRFGHDFSRVRVHFDAEAVEAARSTNARAFTVGNQIVFGDGKYAPYSGEGRKLLGHELAHVVQQTRGGPTPEVKSDAAHEKDADRAANAIASGEAAVYVESATGIGLARVEDDDPEASDDHDPDALKELQPEASDDELTRKTKASTKERGAAVGSSFAERAHDTPTAELAEERTGFRKESSEKSRHRTRDKEIQAHHGFPKFLGGNKVQKYIDLPREIHETYHADLNRVLKEEFAKFHPGEDISPRYFGAVFSRLSKKQQAQVLKRVMQHAAEFDKTFNNTRTSARASPPRCDGA